MRLAYRGWQAAASPRRRLATFFVFDLTSLLEDGWRGADVCPSTSVFTCDARYVLLSSSKKRGERSPPRYPTAAKAIRTPLSGGDVLIQVATLAHAAASECMKSPLSRWRVSGAARARPGMLIGACCGFELARPDAGRHPTMLGNGSGNQAQRCSDLKYLLNAVGGFPGRPGRGIGEQERLTPRQRPVPHRNLHSSRVIFPGSLFLSLPRLNLKPAASLCWFLRRASPSHRYAMERTP
jgi:hypothetical protein